MSGQPILIADGPVLPGLDFRHFAGDSDFLAMSRIINAAKLADNVERSDSPEKIAIAYRSLHNCDPYQDMCFAEVDGEAIGYCRVYWEAQEDGQHTYGHFGFVDPKWRRRKIGQAMLDWSEARLREIARSHTADKKLFRSWAEGDETSTTVLLLTNGYQATTYGAEMSRSILDEIPSAPLPDGLEIRPVEEGQLRQIWEADAEAFRDHWGFRPQTETDWEAFLERPFTDISLWKVAWDNDRVVGQVRSYIDTDENEEYDRLRGYTENISTIKEWRGQGVARALICESMKLLRERGMEEVGLGVHTENPTGAFHLYSNLGYQVDATSTTYEKPLELTNLGRPGLS